MTPHENDVGTSFWLILILGFGNNGISKNICLPFSFPLLHTLQRRASERIGGEEEGRSSCDKSNGKTSHYLTPDFTIELLFWIITVCFLPLLRPTAQSGLINSNVLDFLQDLWHPVLCLALGSSCRVNGIVRMTD